MKEFFVILYRLLEATLTVCVILPVALISFVLHYVIAGWRFGEFLFAPERQPDITAKFKKIWDERPWV